MLLKVAALTNERWSTLLGKVCRGYSIQVSFLHEDKKWGRMLLENSLKECCQLYGPSNSASAVAVPVSAAAVPVLMATVAASLSLQSRCCTLHGTILQEQDAASIRDLSNHLHSPRHHSVRTTARCKQTGSRGEPPWATIMLPAVH